MLVNNKAARVITVGRGEGVPKLILVPGLNVITDEHWQGVAEKSLKDHIAKGIIVPIYKVEKKTEKDENGKEKKVDVNVPCTPDEIPVDKLDDVVNEIKSEDQATEFEKASNKEGVRIKAMNRKKEIHDEIESRKTSET